MALPAMQEAQSVSSECERPAPTLALSPAQTLPHTYGSLRIGNVRAWRIFRRLAPASIGLLGGNRRAVDRLDDGIRRNLYAATSGAEVDDGNRQPQRTEMKARVYYRQG